MKMAHPNKGAIMNKIQPFDTRGGFTMIHNYVLDEMMPALKPSTFKVLMLIIRKTKGWGKDADSISYSQLRDGTGIKSDATLSSAISELAELKYIVVDNDDKWSANNYKLNTTLEIAVGVAPTTKIEVVSTTKIEVGATSKIKDTKEKEIKGKKDTVEPMASTPSDSVVTGKPSDADDVEPSEKDTPEHKQWFEAICWLVYRHKDYSLLSKADQVAIGKTAKSIRGSSEGYTIDDLRNWYKEVWSKEWPGKQRDRLDIQPPTLKQIKVGIGKIKKEQNVSFMPVATKAVGVYVGTVENLR